MPEACWAAVDVTAFLMPRFASVSTKIVFPFWFSPQIVSCGAEDFLVSLQPSRDLIFSCMSPEP